MNAVSFALVLVAILLGAAAQVLLKAGTNAVGHFEFALENALPVGRQLVTEPRILGGTACYALSLVVWIMALSRADLSTVYPMVSLRLRAERLPRLVAARGDLERAAPRRHRGDHDWRGAGARS